MPRSARLLVAILLSILIAHPAAAAGLGWQTDPETAAQLARNGSKMLLVYDRGRASARAASDAERVIAQMSADEVFLHSLESFVPLKIERGGGAAAPPSWLETPREPELALYDASRTLLARFKLGRGGWKAIAEDLLRFRGTRALAAQSAGLRLDGNIAAADFLLGYVMRENRRLAESIAAFRRAADGFRAREDRPSEQLAQLGAATSQFAHGQRPQARAEIGTILENAASPEVKAEATFLLASVLEAYAHTPVRTAPGLHAMSPAQRSPTALAPVISLYREAYSLAAPGSVTEASARAALGRLDTAPLPSKGDPKRSLRIVPPAQTTFTGHSKFLVEAPPETARVELFLDEEKVATSNGAPFRAAFDVGPTPRVRIVKARAWDAANESLGETSIRINDRVDNFYVTIVSPAAGNVHGRAAIEVDVKVPPARTVSQVVLSWNGNEVARLTSPPWVAVVDPDGRGLAYLEAVATLDDGATASATRVYNGALAESVDVAAVTVLAAVANAHGTPARGLVAEDFVIEDEGRRVLHELVSTPNDPVTIGIAIDSSSSMRGRHLYTLRAATTFLERALRPVDEAFVVAFDSRARIVHERSRDVESLRRSILDLIPAGGTSIFDGATFALQQFQGIAGRKALIVFSDGIEGTSSADARETERLARTIGVPVYLFVPRGGARLGHALSAVSDMTGGTRHHGVDETDFEVTFDRLVAELRAQYVLQYARPPGVAPGSWRTIRLTVPDRNVTVRTISGYRAQ